MGFKEKHNTPLNLIQSVEILFWCFIEVWGQSKVLIIFPVINRSSVLVYLISLRHDAYQNTVLAAANRAEVLHGLCFQLTRPVRRHPARPGGVSSPGCALPCGPGGPAAASPPPAVPVSRFPSIGKRPGSLRSTAPLLQQRSVSR